MTEEFEQGELVEINTSNGTWEKRIYLGKIPYRKIDLFVFVHPSDVKRYENGHHFSIGYTSIIRKILK